MDNNELRHYGVPGMKWGHRKTTTTAEINKKRKAFLAAEKAYKQSGSPELKKSYKQAKKSYKSETKLQNLDYTREQRRADNLLWGWRTDRLINRYLNRGATLKEARTEVYTTKGVILVNDIIKDSKAQQQKH